MAQTTPSEHALVCWVHYSSHSGCGFSNLTATKLHWSTRRLVWHWYVDAWYLATAGSTTNVYTLIAETMRVTYPYFGFWKTAKCYIRQIFQIGTVHYAEGLWRMRRHGPVIAHCIDSEDFPYILLFPHQFNRPRVFAQVAHQPMRHQHQQAARHACIVAAYGLMWLMP